MRHNHLATELLAATPAGIARAAALLRGGALVGFGTETVYGLGADATDDRAVLEAAGGQVLALETMRPLAYGKPGWRNPHFLATGRV